MKKFLLVGLLGILGFSQAKAQNNFELGIYFGIPIVKDNPLYIEDYGYYDDYKKDYNLNLGFNAAYYFQIIENLKIGVLTGVDHFVLDYREETSGLAYDEEGDFLYPDIDADGETFLPIAASAKYYFAPKFFAGLDLGAALDVGGNYESMTGLFYRPRISFSTRVIDLYAFYKGLNFKDFGQNAQIGSAGLGINFKF